MRLLRHNTNRLVCSPLAFHARRRARIASTELGKDVVKSENQGRGRQKTRMAPLFHDLAESIDRRALIFIISDMFDEVSDLLLGMKHLRLKKHEVILWHVLDPAETTFQESTLFRGQPTAAGRSAP